MEWKSVAVGIVIALLVVGSIGAFVFGATMYSNNTPSGEQASTTEPTSEPVQAESAPEVVQESLPAAKELKRSLNENGYQNANVSISPTNGEIVVRQNFDANSGVELKDKMSKIAMMYAAAADNSTHGLTVVSNGVRLMVSSDAAVAYDDGRIKKDAFKETFHWSSVSEVQDEG